MRIRPTLALLLLVPSVATAQARRPRIGTGGARPEPAPLGAQPAAIARAQAIIRSHITLETYPMFSHVSAPGFSGGRPVSSWNNFGQGTHIDYRHSEWISTTLDVTASYLGGPATTESVEGGFRIRPFTWDSRLRPYADIRLGWQNSSDQYMSSASAVGIGPASQLASDYRYSRGFGGVIGGGTDIGITGSWSLMTGAYAARTHMSTYNYRLTSVQTTGDSYNMTTYRLVLGLKYNQVRFIQPSTQASQSVH